MFSLKTFALLQLLVTSTMGCLPNNSKEVLKEFTKASLGVILAAPKELPTKPKVPVSTALVTLGNDFQFGCRNERNSSADLLKWYHENTAIGFCNLTENNTRKAYTNNFSCDVHYTGSGCSLRVMNVSSDDLGAYTCQTWKLGRIDSQHSCRLAVVEPTRRNTYAPEYIEANSKDYVTLPCNIPMKDRYMTARWFIGSTELTSEASWSKNETSGYWKRTLLIPNAQAKNSGIYICQLNMGNLYLEKSVELRVSPIPRNFKIYSVHTGENVTLACPVKARATDAWIFVQWESRTRTSGRLGNALWGFGRPIKTLEANNEWYELGWTDGKWNLYIVNATSKNAGQYICKARYGIRSFRFQNEFFQLNVVLPNGTTVME